MKKLIGRLFRNEQSFLPYADLICSVRQIPLCNLSCAQLKEKANQLRGKNLQEKSGRIPALALGTEIIYRVLGYRLYDTQISTAISLLNGRVAELPTGEGKTLAAVLAAAVLALSGRSVQILVFNDYLAKRDFLLSEPVYKFLDLSVGFIQQSFSAEERQRVYDSNVVYISAKEAGFDFLRNFICTKEKDILNVRQDFAIVDEADSILIDEAKIPMVLAGTAPEDLLSTGRIARAAEILKSCDVSVNHGANQVYLTDQGIARMEAALSVDNLYAQENINVLSMVNAALQAKYLLSRDKDYLVKDGSVFLIDEFTGRVSPSRRYPDILHSAVEAKEHLTSSRGSMIYNTMTLRDFLMRYKTLSGMSGTIRTSSEEVFDLYGLYVDVIPPNKPCIRTDYEDRLFRTNEERNKAVVSEIAKAHRKGQPVLVGTQSVEESERLSSLLWVEKIPHSVLNAKNNEEEAELIAKAGEPGRITVSTNMAGRGVDIRLGGVREQDRQKVLAAGGLSIIGTGVNRSIRIDNQLRGRAGRQGDPGESRFFISLEDTLFLPYAEDFPAAEGNGLITDHSLLKAVRKVQRYAEGEDAEARYMLGKYSFIQEKQRQEITRLRNDILTNQKKLSVLFEYDPDYYQIAVNSAGIQGVEKAEKQLALYFINLRWAQYLESMEYVRDGIHLTLIGGKNPIDEYHRIAISAFDEMMQDITDDILASMKRYRITPDGIDMESNGLNGATTTWTYLIDESSKQFSRIPGLIKNVSSQIKGTVFTVSGLFRRLASPRVK